LLRGEQRLWLASRRAGPRGEGKWHVRSRIAVEHGGPGPGTPIDTRTASGDLLQRYRAFLPVVSLGLAMPGAGGKGDVCAGGFVLSAFGFLFSRLLLC
jgi:hypothetical protein